MSRLWIDHAIYAVGDLDAAAEEIWEREGLGSVPGGRHKGWGTANRIIPLGETYLELITVVDRDEAEQSDFGRAVLKALAEDSPLVGWVVATDDIDAVAGRLDLEVESKSREAQGGSTLSWRVAGLGAAMESKVLPFFVEWERSDAHHPGGAEVGHDADPEGIAWIEVTTDDRDRVRDWLGEDFEDEKLRITEGEPGLRAVAIATAGGAIVFH